MNHSAVTYTENQLKNEFVNRSNNLHSLLGLNESIPLYAIFVSRLSVNKDVDITDCDFEIIDYDKKWFAES